jgi:glycine hydroxymethyltransferase
MQTSGIRLGTPAMTTRGLGVDEMRTIGRWIADVLRAPDDEAVRRRVHAGARELTAGFPLPGVERDAHRD